MNGCLPTVHGLGDDLLEQADILRAVPLPVYATDASGRISFFNAAAAQLWGREPGPEARYCGALRLRRMDDGALLPPEQSPLALTLASGRSHPGEMIVERPDGEQVVVMAHPAPIFDSARVLIGATALLVPRGSAQDDGRHDAGLAARRLAAIVESSDDAILAKNLDGIITDFNSGAERLFGYAAAEVIGRPVTMLIPEERHDEEPSILGRIRRGERIEHYETVRRRKDGSLVEISLSVSPLKAADGTIIGASKIARDITERRRAQEQQQLLLREMSHRVKNLFALAGSLVTLSSRFVATPRELATVVGDRLAALARAHDLTMSRAMEAEAGEINATLHGLVATILAPFDDLGGNQKRRFTVSGIDLPVAGTALTSLALMIHEFATNAAKYGALSVPDGTITVETSFDQGVLQFDWTERGGPVVAAMAAEGFGSVLVRATIKGQLGGSVSRDFQPDGLFIRLAIPADRLAPAA